MIHIKWRKLIIFSLMILLSLSAAACNFPGRQPTDDIFATSAALTVVARLTEAAMDTTPEPLATTPPPPAPTTPAPTHTESPPTATSTEAPTQLPCDRAQYLKDITIPDGTELEPGETFTKTWQIKNTGTCTWNTGYALIFDSGDSMGGPASKPIAAANVAPQQTVDVSVDLTAPSKPGSYRGNWKLRNASGVEFGFGTAGKALIWVEIEVVPVTTTTNLTAVEGESGSVLSNGVVAAARNTGDTLADVSTQAFFSFNVSGLPSDATIVEVEANFTSFSQQGTPFDDLGCLDLFDHPYGTLDGSDYFSGTPSNRLIRWCTSGSLTQIKIDDDMVTAVQANLGSSRFQIRLQFQNAISADTENDMVQFELPVLKITYWTP
jgi:hypothetical protein